MPRLDGLQATGRLLEQQPGVRVLMLVLVTFDLDESVFDALRAGASGSLLKDAPPDELVHALRVVAEGEALRAPTVTRRLIEEFTRQPLPGADARIDRLTPREREVLTLVAIGVSNAEIASRLYLGESTVKTLPTAVLSELGVRDRVQAVVLTYQAGLVRPGGE